jgi:hypothetical protein
VLAGFWSSSFCRRTIHRLYMNHDWACICHSASVTVSLDIDRKLSSLDSTR